MYPNLELEMFKQNVTTKQLAEHCGISESCMRNKLKGRSEPKLTELKAISKKLGRPWEYLFASEEEAKKNAAS